MIPSIFPFAHGGLVAQNIIIVMSWVIFSFLFWLWLRRFAVEEDKIFDLTFFATGVALITARLGFVALHTELFWGKSPLLMLAMWVAPGLSWTVGLIGGVITVVVLSRQYKVRLGLVLDAIAAALPFPLVIGSFGALLLGDGIGKPGSLLWGRIPGLWPGTFHHNVALYECISFLIMSLIIIRLMRVSIKAKWAYGMVGVWFFLLYSLVGFALEFFKDSRVYWDSLTANQWMLIGIFAECVGVVYVRGGGREFLRPRLHTIILFVREKGKQIHESISRRNTR